MGGGWRNSILGAALGCVALRVYPHTRRDLQLLSSAPAGQPEVGGGGREGEIPPGSVSLSTEPLVLPAAKASLNSQAAKLASSKTFLFSPSMSSSVCNVREDSEQAGEDVPGTLPSLSLSISIILGHGGCKPLPLHLQPSGLS